MFSLLLTKKKKKSNRPDILLTSLTFLSILYFLVVVALNIAFFQIQEKTNKKINTTVFKV